MAFAKPESSLKRAEELINVGQKQDALQELYGLITSHKFKAWQKTHEKIMLKFLEICVDLQKGRYAKEGLIKYRSMCTQVNVNSLEEVIKHFLSLSTKKAEMARNSAQALEEALDFDDLEADRKPEDLMMSVVSGEKGKDRSDRELVTPWFKFLWETYRTALEISKNNSKLIALYADTMHRAFQFCKQYKRKTEFHRLCDILRHHLVNLHKYRDQRDRPDLMAQENLQFYLDARFEQLKIATELELWQEAFRSVEDIYGLACMVQKMPKPSLMATYYAKLAEVFWMSSNHLYHAYSWFKLFNLQKSHNKNQSQKDLQLIASSVLLAALSVPPYDHTRRASHLGLEYDKQRNLRMSNIIGFNIEGKLENDEMLSRSNLLAELVSKGVTTYAAQEVKDIYHLLEHEFLPLDLVSKIQPLLLKISKIGGKVSSASSMPEVQLSQYIPALEKLATLRLLQQVSQVYHSMTMEKLSKMIPFYSVSDIEKLSVDAVKNHFIAMKANHMNGVVMFGNLGFESDDLRDQLRILAESLNKSRDMIYPPAKKSRIGELLPSLADTVDKEHKRLLARRAIIEKRKEDQERHLLQTEKEEDLTKERQRKLEEAAEKKRRDLEKQRRNERVRQQKEMEERKAKEDEEKERARKMEEMKIKKKSFFLLGKKMDHFERARREEAAPLMQAAFQHRLELERVLHERQQKEEVELSRVCHAEELKQKSRLSRMLENKNIFEKTVSERRRAEFERMRAARDERNNTILAQHMAERDLKRKMIYFLNQEEEKQQKILREEEAHKLAEAERRKKEEAERKKAEAEHKAKLDQIAEKQRQREREIEERERLRRESILGQTVVSSPEPAAPAAPPAAAPPPSSTGKYVPKFRRSETSAATPPPETDRWRRDDNRGPTRPWKPPLRT